MGVKLTDMIVPVNAKEARLIWKRVKSSKIVADPKNRWRPGSLIHLYTAWPAAGGVPLREEENGAKMVRRCKSLLFVEMILRDNTAHIYLSEEKAGGPPKEVLRYDSNEMKRLAFTEGADGVDDFLNRYFPGWRAADPDEWQFWQGKIIFW